MKQINSNHGLDIRAGHYWVKLKTILLIVEWRAVTTIQALYGIQISISI